MKDMGNINNINFKSLANIRRFHMVIFIVVVATGLTVAVLLLNSVVIRSSGSDSALETGSSPSFDQNTINRIKQLKTVNEPSEPLDFSKGRISPFSE